jgi:lysophospholipase L1-like esterase
MKNILVYADSLSWGLIPLTRRRLSFAARWPGVLEHTLLANGLNTRVSEHCLNGRRTVWEDPFKPGRNGLLGLAQLIEAQSPLDLVILMLGTNDFQSMHDLNAWHSAQGTATLIREIRLAPIEPGMIAPPILVVAPPPILLPKGAIAPKFLGGDVKCLGLATALAQVCLEQSCSFFDAASVVTSSSLDGVHLDAAQHLTLGQAIAAQAQKIFI